ncbi:MAG: type II toxin-antitoxin system PemK/MazF family toxin [Candidatus Nanoarchaeia archaeon]|nr:type II toxin-antitoxin system PemK/MazF family toxin [Candidatus Nanoarchaeia archaeon]
MEGFIKRDVVLFPFPYTDLKNRKIRPCLVLSDEMKDDILLCQITSQNLAKDQYCVELKRDATLEGGLLIDSFIRANMLFTANKKQIHKKICRVDDKDYKEVTNIINKVIG